MSFTTVLHRFLKKAFGVILVSLFLFVTFSVVVHAEELESAENAQSFYSISFEDPQWRTFETTEEMREAVALDEGTFDNLSTEEVLRAVLEYPLIGDIFAFDTNKLGIERVSEHCSALRVFLERDDAYDVLSRAISNTEWMEARVQAPDVAKMGIPYILRELQTYLESVEDVGGMPERATVYTPNGTPVYIMSYLK